jgi:hypothetical protein
LEPLPIGCPKRLIHSRNRLVKHKVVSALAPEANSVRFVEFVLHSILCSECYVFEAPLLTVAVFVDDGPSWVVMLSGF